MPENLESGAVSQPTPAPAATPPAQTLEQPTKSGDASWRKDFEDLNPERIDAALENKLNPKVPEEEKATPEEEAPQETEKPPVEETPPMEEKPKELKAPTGFTKEEVRNFEELAAMLDELPDGVREKAQKNLEGVVRMEANRASLLGKQTTALKRWAQLAQSDPDGQLCNMNYYVRDNVQELGEPLTALLNSHFAAKQQGRQWDWRKEMAGTKAAEAPKGDNLSQLEAIAALDDDQFVVETGMDPKVGRPIINAQIETSKALRAVNHEKEQAATIAQQHQQWAQDFAETVQYLAGQAKLPPESMTNEFYDKVLAEAARLRSEADPATAKLSPSLILSTAFQTVIATSKTAAARKEGQEAEKARQRSMERQEIGTGEAPRSRASAKPGQSDDPIGDAYFATQEERIKKARESYLPRK